MKINQLKFF